MKDLKIMLMGTPKFAVTVFEKIILDKWNVIGIISQPDRPVGRKKVLLPTSTKELAIKYAIPVFQVEKIKLDYQFIKEMKPDLIITCAYGQIVPQGLLDIPPYGCLNVHGSLLPKLRGGAPIHRSLMNGETQTGITIIEMVAKMDAGKMYAQKSLPILDSDNLDSLSTKLSLLGADLIIDILPKYLNGELQGIEQDESQVTFGYNIQREEERINWNQQSRSIFNHIRALSSSPGAYTTYNGKSVKIFASEISALTYPGIAGEIVDISNGLVVKTLDGALKVLELQIAGKNKMTGQNFINGHPKNLLHSRFE